MSDCESEAAGDAIQRTSRCLFSYYLLGLFPHAAAPSGAVATLLVTY